MAEKLKPCPFCGGDVKIINAEELTINHHRSGGRGMRKLQFTLTLCIIMAVLFAACNGSKAEPANAASVIDTRGSYNNVFERVGYGNSYDIVYHKQTKVMYVVSEGEYNRGSFTLLVNSDGTPMIYKTEVGE